MYGQDVGPTAPLEFRVNNEVVATFTVVADSQVGHGQHCKQDMQTLDRPTFEALSSNFNHWKKAGDLIDQCIDLMLNLRQSGHPGGSRSKVPLLVASTLGAGMRWDIRRPELAFGDRFVLVACLLYTSPSPRDRQKARMPSSA